MTHLEDAFADYNEIEQSVSSGNAAILESQGVSLDDTADVEKELDAMIENERLYNLENQLRGLTVHQDEISNVPSSNSIDEKSKVIVKKEEKQDVMLPS